jgi:hypothetical protein
LILEIPGMSVWVLTTPGTCLTSYHLSRHRRA